jgi:outer membrane protein TolC
MSRLTLFAQVGLTVFMAVLAGCHPEQPFYFKKIDGDLAYYKDQATDIEVPDVDADRLDDVAQAKRPYSLINSDKKEMWDLTLEEAMQIALRNNKVMRNIGGQIQGPPDFILRNPEIAPTIYDAALAESNPRTGPEAALAAFDAQWSNSLTWQRYDTPMNVGWAPYQYSSPRLNNVDQAVFQTKVSKTAVSGGQFSLGHNISYNNYYNWDQRYSYLKQYATDWNVNLTAELRQPLLQGAGVQFNRIAGPGAQPGVYNGVVLARINTDIALTDFESAVADLVSDVEVAYWELYFQYRSLDAVIAGRDSALSTWRRIYTLYRIGGKGGEAEKEAQARQQYYLFRKTAEQSLNALYSAEAKLRYLIGLAATDGRLIRPKDEPTTAKVVFDWYEVLNEALVRNVDLRQEKWIVKRRELELIAAKNFLLPKVDFVAQYRWLGFGDQLDGTGVWNPDVNNTSNTNAYRSLTSGDYQEWQAGFVSNIPIGFRRELAGVRNAQLQLAKERTKLQEGELELSHQLAHSIRELEANHVLSQTEFNRRVAAQREVEAVTAAYETDTITLDVLLKAQQNLAQAESDYYRALVDFNKAITTVHPWPEKAYFDARRRARAREASTYLDYGFTQPRVISRGGYQQHIGQPNAGALDGTDAAPTSQPELVPTPEPSTMQPKGEKESSSRSPEALPKKNGVSIPVPPAAPKPKKSKPTSNFQASDSTLDQLDVKWNPAAKSRQGVPTKRIVDNQVSAVSWVVSQEGSNHESGENSAAHSANRSTSNW